MQICRSMQLPFNRQCACTAWPRAAPLWWDELHIMLPIHNASRSRAPDPNPAVCARLAARVSSARRHATRAYMRRVKCTAATSRHCAAGARGPPPSPPLCLQMSSRRALFLAACVLLAACALADGAGPRGAARLVRRGALPTASPQPWPAAALAASRAAQTAPGARSAAAEHARRARREASDRRRQLGEDEVRPEEPGKKGASLEGDACAVLRLARHRAAGGTQYG